MKKILSILGLLLLLVSTSLGAYTYPEFYYPELSVRPISARVEAMGGAGLAIASPQDALFLNPAILGSRIFSLSLPTVSVTLFNPLAIIDSGIIEDIQAEEDVETIAMNYMELVTAGRGEVLTTDIRTSVTVGGFGAGWHIQEQLHTLSSDGSLASDTLIAEVNATAVLGYGYRISIAPNRFSLDLGVSVRPTYKAFSSQVGANEALALVDEEDPLATVLETTKLAAGWAVPFDIGLQLNMPFGLRTSLVVRNLNGTYTMQNYPEAGLWVNEMAEMVGADPVYTDADTTNNTITSFEHVVPWSLDIGFGWKPLLGSLNKMVSPALAVDVVDLLSLAEDTEHFWNYLRAGLEVKLVSMVDLRAGLNNGYLSLGAGLDVLVIHVDASYYWREFGTEIGDKPIDAFTVAFQLGVH